VGVAWCGWWCAQGNLVPGWVWGVPVPWGRPTFLRTCINTHTHTDRRRHTHTHAHTHTRRHTRTHTHTHTHTPHLKPPYLRRGSNTSPLRQMPLGSSRCVSTWMRRKPACVACVGRWARRAARQGVVCAVWGGIGVGQRGGGMRQLLPHTRGRTTAARLLNPCTNQAPLPHPPTHTPASLAALKQAATPSSHSRSSSGVTGCCTPLASLIVK
jgi:hypothetical protein